MTGTPTGLPRGALGLQQALASLAGATGAAAVDDSEPLPNTGMSPSVWKCSQATPCGSVIQCFSLRA